MGKARRIVLATRTFEKHGDAIDFFRKILNSYAVCSRVSDADAVELNALLQRHDEFGDKVGSGIANFEVDRGPDEYGTQCFWITRTDGSKVDFSYIHCLERKPYD